MTIEYQIKYICRDTRNNEKIMFVDSCSINRNNNQNLPINEVVTYIIQRCLSRRERGYKFIEIVSIEKIPLIGEEIF